MEVLKSAAKQHHRHHAAGHFKNGVQSFHRYDHRTSNDLSWWDDCAFVLNDYRVNLAWLHPRMCFNELVKELAFARVDQLKSDDFLLNSTPIYQRVGNSRKKITAWESKHTGPSSWHEAFQQACVEIVQTEDIGITPFIKAHWTNRSRFVELCAPVEVRNQEDLVLLVNLTKRLLKRETTLEEQFPGYCYRRTDWEQDVLANEQSTPATVIDHVA